ncbi:MAG: Fe-S cluster assembly protein SufD [Thermoleophilaceae bacterium]|nr:Fe-S cluster assembly protein SufD [Thermoleophilaceae bacterium]
MASPTLSEPPWLAARRERAASLAETLELPSFKGTPGWEFTDLSGLDVDSYEPASGGDADAIDRAEKLFRPFEGGILLDQVDGVSAVMAEVDAPSEPFVLPLDVAAERFPELVEKHLGTVVDSEDPFVARNERGWTGGVFVYVPRGKRLDAPALVTAVQEQSGTSLNWRTLIVLEEGAEAEVWEQYLSADADTDGLFNTVVELVVGANAKLRYVCGQSLSEKSSIFGTQRAVVERDGSLDWVALGFGSARGKVRMETNLAGEGSHGKDTGAYAGHARQHLDFDTTQEHAAANTVSDLAFRGVLSGRSQAVWRGMIKVDPGAQKTDAFQESRNLLLSKRAHADAIPGLEILANDVRCTHAAAIAQIDPEQVFYLMSRGIPRGTATRLVIEGFLAELVERFEEGPVREQLTEALLTRLAHVLD